jgi:hypothetical protein
MRTPYCMCLCPLSIVKAKLMAVASQRIHKYVPASPNTHATIEKLLNAMFSMRPVPYEILSMW